MQGGTVFDRATQVGQGGSTTPGVRIQPPYNAEFEAKYKENLAKRFDWLDQQLAGKEYLLGSKFSVADAYLFTLLRWTKPTQIDLAKWPNLKAYLERVGDRPKVKEALKAEGLA